MSGLSSVKVVDADSHVTEPPDLWTSRITNRKWQESLPRVVTDDKVGIDRWLIGGRKLIGVASQAAAGWPEHIPSHPPTVEAADPAAFFPEARLERMDEYGIYAQALYPNLLAFFHHAFMKLEPDLRIACVRAYNDFLTEFASVAPERFILLSALPFWNVEESVREIERCHAMGHHGVVFIGKPYKLDLPRLSDDHWAPILRTVEDLGWSVNFHIGFSDFNESELKSLFHHRNDRADYAKFTSVSMLNTAETIADVIMSGVCERYPTLKFVSVESGFGWIPSLVEAMDWEWQNSGAAKAHPDRQLPSFYFERQVMGMFWFEHEPIRRLLDLYPNNVMFETDFPHSSSLSPGPASTSRNPREVVASTFAGLPEDLTRKVLYENAANLYHLDGR